MPFEKLLQRCRFKKALPHLWGNVLDFGGNGGELGQFIHVNKYVSINSIEELNTDLWDNIACLAVLEHMNYSIGRETLLMLVSFLDNKGKIVITTPSKILHPVLKLLAWCGILDKQNIAEHKRYWTKREFIIFAGSTKMKIEYHHFQFGLNQLVILKKE